MKAKILPNSNKKRHNCGVFLLLEIKEKYMSEIRFSSKAHEQFYYQMLEKCGGNRLMPISYHFKEE